MSKERHKRSRAKGLGRKTKLFSPRCPESLRFLLTLKLAHDARSLKILVPRLPFHPLIFNWNRGPVSSRIHAALLDLPQKAAKALPTAALQT